MERTSTHPAGSVVTGTMSYTNGIAPIVTVYGPGNLHHLTYTSAAGLGNAVGLMPTTSTGTTNFLLGFLFDWRNYAFYWDGAGEAFWRMTNSTVVEPVGTSWADATGVPWGTNEIILGLNVEAEVSTAGNVGADVPVFFIPGDLD
ncbi:hypothetical protein B0H11DRAFT_1886485 [Mycena galericulata]|nr:hypothetical protein B0H11DRAFT_1886485 [Mycena galericulata]